MVNTAAMSGSGVLPLASLNHISIVCRSLEASLRFYTEVLGFVPIRRPGSFNFDGAWLFNYGIGIHLLQSEDPDSLQEKREINPKDNHISFQCESVAAAERRLKETAIPYVDQIFFHDPDGFMIEVCNCDNIPVVPLAAGDHRAPVMAACERVAAAVVKQHQQRSVPSSKTAAIRVGEEAHISCARDRGHRWDPCSCTLCAAGAERTTAS